MCSALSSFKPSCRSWSRAGPAQSPRLGLVPGPTKNLCGCLEPGREGRIQSWQRRQGRGRAWDTPSSSLLHFSCPKRELCVGPDCCNKSLGCSALCWLSLGWDCCSLSSLHTSRGKWCQHLSSSPCVAFFPSPHFCPAAALSCDCWSCCTQGF